MTIYIILLFVVLFSIFLETTFTKINIKNFEMKSRDLSFFVCFVFIFLLGVMRKEDLGVDVDAYKSYFLYTYSSLNIKFFIGNFNYDFGYVILNKIVGLFTDNFRIFEIIVYCISFGIFSTIVYKESRYPALSFLIYIGLEFIGFNMCILRQSVACALCFAAYYYLERNKKLKYIGLVVIAILFHKTAVFFLLTYLLSWKRNEVKSYKYSFGLILLFFVGFNLVLPLLYGIYNNDYSNMVVSGQGYKLLLFYIVTVLIISLIIKNNSSSKEIMQYKCSSGAMYIQTGALSFALFTRITKYFAILFTLSIPNIVYRSKYKKIYIMVYSIMFSILYIYGLYSNEMEVVPYKLFI